MNPEPHAMEDRMAQDLDRTKNRNSETILRGIKLLNAAGNVISFYTCWHLFYQGGTRLNLSLLLICGYALFFVWLARIYNSYHIDYLRISEVLYSLSLASVLSNGIVYFAIVGIRWQWVNLFPLIVLICIQFLWNALWAYCANRIYFRLYMPKSAAVVYRNEDELEKIQELVHTTEKYRIEKYIKDPFTIEAVMDEIGGYQVVFVIGIPATLRNGIAKFCVDKDIELFVIPHVGDVIMAGAQHMQMYSVPTMRVLRAKPIPEYLFIKRSTDIVISLLALVILSPIMLMTAIAIKLYDGGPVIYRQKRLTKDRRVFEIYKYRSMIVSAESDGQARLASECDQRITPVGKVIRACRLDELPQLINILKGDMSIVGPRPERPEIAEQYEKTIPAFSLRLQVKAGLTGFAQVYGRYNTTPYDKLQMDLMYINRMSLLEDIRLMLATVKVLFQKESTSGIEIGAITAMDTIRQKTSGGGASKLLVLRVWEKAREQKCTAAGLFLEVAA